MPQKAEAGCRVRCCPATCGSGCGRLVDGVPGVDSVAESHGHRQHAEGEDGCAAERITPAKHLRQHHHDKGRRGVAQRATEAVRAVGMADAFARNPLVDDAEILGVYTQLELLMTLTAIQAFRKLEASHTRLFINLAPESIKKRIYDGPIAAGVFDNIKFVIEIIERGEVFPEVMSLLDKTIAKLNALIALDDFGTGYSNHLALLNSKPDIVKISHELIEGIASNIDKQQVYENTVSFASGLGTLVLAEGIETRSEFETCLRLGMDFAQGYYIGKPIKEIAVLPSEIKEIVNRYEAFNSALIREQMNLRESIRSTRE